MSEPKWTEEAKARLDRDTREMVPPSYARIHMDDIRAALARIEELERENERLATRWNEAITRGDEGWRRAEASEAKLAEKGRAFGETLLLQSEELAIVPAELAAARAHHEASYRQAIEDIHRVLEQVRVLQGAKDDAEHHLAGLETELQEAHGLKQIARDEATKLRRDLDAKDHEIAALKDGERLVVAEDRKALRCNIPWHNKEKWESPYNAREKASE